MPSPTETCIICAENLDVFALASCNHAVVCGMCAMRLRLLNGDETCCVCKQSQETVILTRDATKNFEDYDTWGKSGLTTLETSVFADRSARDFADSLRHLRSFRCSNSGCTFVPQTQRQLMTHLRQAHNLDLCKLCCEGRSVFPQEQVLYTPEALQAHIAGDDAHLDNFHGHPQCGMCQTHHFDEAALWSHMWSKHHHCPHCTEVAGYREFFSTLGDLRDHIHATHLVCDNAACASTDPYSLSCSFASEIDLVQHMRTVHPGLQTSTNSTIQLHCQPHRRSPRHARRAKGLASVRLPLRLTTSNSGGIPEDVESWPTLHALAPAPAPAPAPTVTAPAPTPLAKRFGGHKSKLTDGDFPSLGGNVAAPVKASWAKAQTLQTLAGTGRRSRRGLVISLH